LDIVCPSDLDLKSTANVFENVLKFILWYFLTLGREKQNVHKRTTIGVNYREIMEEKKHR